MILFPVVLVVDVVCDRLSVRIFRCSLHRLYGSFSCGWICELPQWSIRTLESSTPISTTKPNSMVDGLFLCDCVCDDVGRFAPWTRK
jgi:hypothetical protein